MIRMFLNSDSAVATGSETNLYTKISLAYWPNPSKNESANREAGDAVVDKLSIGELNNFFTQHNCGPTYCLVRERVQSYRPLFEQFFDASHIERHVVEKKVLGIIADLVETYTGRKQAGQFLA